MKLWEFPPIASFLLLSVNVEQKRRKDAIGGNSQSFIGQRSKSESSRVSHPQQRRRFSEFSSFFVFHFIE
jgi:hypothetical protein